MCNREGRDEHGRFAAGASGNPRGRPPRSAYVKLLRAAEAAGATVVVCVPPAVANDEIPPVPPVAA